MLNIENLLTMKPIFIAQDKRIVQGKQRKIDEIVRLYIEEIFTEV